MSDFFEHQGRYRPIGEAGRLHKEEAIKKLFANFSHKWDITEELAKGGAISDKLAEILEDKE